MFFQMNSMKSNELSFLFFRQSVQLTFFKNNNVKFSSATNCPYNRPEPDF